MGFLVDSSVKPVSSLEPIDIFCKRPAKDIPPVLSPAPPGPAHMASRGSVSQPAGTELAPRVWGPSYRIVGIWKTSESKIDSERGEEKRRRKGRADGPGGVYGQVQQPS